MNTQAYNLFCRGFNYEVQHGLEIHAVHHLLEKSKIAPPGTDLGGCEFNIKVLSTEHSYFLLSR